MSQDGMFRQRMSRTTILPKNAACTVPCAGCIAIETVEWLANDYAKMRLEGGLYLARGNASKITDRYHPLLSLHLDVSLHIWLGSITPLTS